MANNSSNISILKPGENGVVWYAPVGTDLPTAVGEELDPAFKTCGYISAAGIERSDNFEAGEGVAAFGGDIVVNGTSTMQPSRKFTIWETQNPDALALAYNENDISGTAGNVELTLTDKLPDDYVMVFQFLRTNSIVQWETYPHMVFGSRDDSTNDNETPDGLPVTWNARKENGVFGKVLVGQIVLGG